LSYDENEIRKMVREVLADKNKIRPFFVMLQLHYKQLIDKTKANEDLLKSDVIKSAFGIQYHPLLQLLEGLLTMSRTMHSELKIVYFMLEELALKTFEQPTPAEMLYKPEDMLSRDDRKAVDWLKKYFEHSEGDESGQ
jgi:hypothetical protein